MTDKDPYDCGDECFNLTRRDFGAMVVGAGLTVAAGSAWAAASVKETDVTITTPDGVCDAVLLHPEGGAHPAVIMWPDINGLRPTFRAMGKRLAAEGYAVLVPNPFYRMAPAPEMESRSRDDKMNARKALTAPGATEKDATAFLALLDKQSAVKKTAKMGTSGYCMGGPLTMRTAALFPDRVGAGASFHGAALVTPDPDSPHLLVPKIKAKFMFCIAENDDTKEPDAKDKLRAAFATANNPADVEVYAANHGWCVPDAPVYNEALAEKAWAKMLTLFKAALV
jgi:carboxymethylenebutenolidase